MTVRVTAESRWMALLSNREPYLVRGREASELTIPTLLPPEGYTNQDLSAPAQSDGAKCVNSLSAKFLFSTVPSNVPPFKLETIEALDFIMEDRLKAQMSESGMDESEFIQKRDKIRQETRKELDRIPRACLTLTEAFKHRPIIFEGFRHLIVAGNVLFWFMAGGTIRAVPLSRYCVLRDSLAFPLEVVIRDSLSAANLPPKLQEILRTKKTQEEILKDAATVKNDSPNSPYALYTYACWYPEEEKYHFHQEFMGEIVEGTTALYKEENFPLVPLRFSASDGEDYGHGHVEHYIGPLMSIEALAQGETSLAIAMSDVRVCISPASPLRARDWMASPVGQPLDIDPAQVGSVAYEGQAQLAEMRASKMGLQKDIAIAFLDVMALQRDGERVTATEWEKLTLNLENTLGGTQSLISVGFLGPYANYQLRLLKEQEGIDILANDAVRVRLVTGLAALGQTSEGQQFFAATQAYSALVGPQAFAEMVNPEALANKIYGYYNVEIAGVYKSDEQLAAEREAEAQRALNEKATPAVVAGAAKIATTPNQQAAA